MNRDRFSLDQISVRGLCVDLFRNIWMVLLAAAAVWCAATAWHNLTFVPAYTSSATLVVGVKGDSSAYSSLSVATQMADVFGQVFQSEALREKIMEDVGEEIEGSISCSLISETNLLVLKATCPEPRQAYVFLYSALEHYEEVSGQVFANAELEIVQEPNVPLAPSNTSWMMRYRYLLMAAAAAGMAALIALCYVLRFTVKSAGSAEQQLDGKILGVIPYERKNVGRKEGKNPKQALLLNLPSVSMGYAEAGRRMEAKVEYRMRRRGQKILLVTSIGENEGKSTVAANLALSMAEKHKKVLLVDGDLRKPAQHKIFEENEENRISFDQILEGEAGWREALQCRGADGIREIFQFREVKSPEKSLRENRIRNMLQEWKQEMDYIIIDCSPIAVSADAEVWMNVVDTVLLVVREDWADIRSINDAVDLTRETGTDFAGFVLNAFHREWIHTLGEHRYGEYGSYGTYGETARKKEDKDS